MPQQIRAIVVDPGAPGKLAIKPVELRDPDRDEVVVRVTAISLNRGETRRALTVAEPGWRPGWDFAGVVETAAADRSGPKPGTRVVGLLRPVPGRNRSIAAATRSRRYRWVSDAQAATLPVAGLTAWHALRQGGMLLAGKCWSMGLRAGSAILLASLPQRPVRRSGPRAAAGIPRRSCRMVR